MRVVISQQPQAGLREIAHCIAHENPARARSFVLELRTKALQLGDAPRAFPLVPRFEHYGIRRRTVRDYLIFYSVTDHQVFIVHILHGARDYEPLLSSDS